MPFAARENVNKLPRVFIEADDTAIPAAGIDKVGVKRIGRDVAVFEASDGPPVAESDFAVIAAAGHGGGAAILLGCVGNVRKLIVGDDVIELAGGLIEPGRPGLAAVVADDCALVDAENNVGRILRINPHRMVIVAAGSAFEGNKSLAAIGGAISGSLHHVADVGVAGIDEDAAEIQRAENARVLGALLP